MFDHGHGLLKAGANRPSKYLETVLLLGKIWGCGKLVKFPWTFYCLPDEISCSTKLVVLLDEADVFLEERSLTDLKRNALVSGE